MISLKSIFSRIIFLHVIAVMITAIFMPLVLYWFLKSAASDLHNTAMREQADLVAHYLALVPNGDWTLDLPPALQDLYSPAYGRYAYLVHDESGRILFSSLGERASIISADSRLSGNGFPEIPHANAAMSGVSLTKEMGGRKVWVRVGEDLAHRDVIMDDIVADFFKRVGWITLPILLLLLAIDILIFRRALRPLLSASEMAKKINPNRTDVRLPPDNIPKEILPLIQAVNQALDRLEAGFRVQREFTADAAHELRTPLTILRSRLDTLTDRASSKALYQDIDGMARVVSQLLDIAELETLSIDPFEKADLHTICAEVIEFSAPLAVAKGKNIALSDSDAPVWVNGNPEMLSRAIRNLVENAINYSASGTTVEIVVGSTGLIEVLDEGPGIKEDERELIFQRFWRRDRQQVGGAGLGLSIVRRIADAHAAIIRVENRPTGGANFSMSFARVA
jgi:signal transduction histidine kinase